MTPEEFRTAGRDLVDWIADYWERIEEFPVRSQVEPGWVTAQLPRQAPSEGESFDAVLRDLTDIVLPGVTHWQHPGFHAYFNSGGSAPSVLGELAAAGLGVQGMLWITSPAATEVETVVLDWLADLLGLPEPFFSTSTGGGVIQDSASSATLVAILAARERATQGRGNQDGLPGLDHQLTVYTSAHAHSSVEKGVRAAGLGSAAIRSVPVDETYAMDPDALRDMVAADVAAGCVPTIVVANVGTTSSTAIDPVAAIADVCEEFDIWLHVDAALAGSAAVLPELRWILDGTERADSFVMNPHKWLLVNMDCSAFWVADRDALTSALSIDPEYLRQAATDSGSVIDYRDWQLPLGRRFRALKLWFVLRMFGVEEIRRIVAEHLRLTRLFASFVEADPDFELMAPHPVNLVCFRHVGGEAVNQRIMDTVNHSGEAFFTHTVLNGAFTLRMAIGAERTEEHHVQKVWDLIRAAAP